MAFIERYMSWFYKAVLSFFDGCANVGINFRFTLDKSRKLLYNH